MSHELFLGDCKEILKTIESESVHLAVIDPPYFIDKLGDDWDTNTVDNSRDKAGVIGGLPVGMKFDPQQGRDFQDFMFDISKEIFRILKPGAFYICFSQARLYHRLGVAVEDAGFELRDMLGWKYEGQAKAFSQDHFVRKMKISEDEKSKIVKELGGRKTPQLKPQIEPMTLAQKPKDGTFIENWLRHKTGLIDTSVSLDGTFPGNIMDCPKPTKDEKNKGLENFVTWDLEDQNQVRGCLSELQKVMSGNGMPLLNDVEWNTSLFGNNTSVKCLMDIKSIIATMFGTTTESRILNYSLPLNTNESIRAVIEMSLVSGLSLADLVAFIRESKPNTINEKMVLVHGAVLVLFETLLKVSNRGNTNGNTHVTVKPVRLIKHLINLFSVPGQIVIDPFMGSGSHGVAAIEADRSFIGIEREQHYFNIASNRINSANKNMADPISFE